MIQEDRILVAIKRIVRPVVRLLISRNVRLPQLVAALKQVYVDVAEKEFRLNERAPTDSRVSLLTGVHRQDVSNIRRSGIPASLPSKLSPSATVIGRWLGDPIYCDKNGKAKPIFRSSEQGAPSFEDLARKCSKDIHPRTILDELIDQELVSWDEQNDIVALTSFAYVPTDNDEQVIQFFEMNLHDHLAAAVNNVINDGSGDRFLERAVYYNSLQVRSIDQLGALARERADIFLTELNSEALRHQDADLQVRDTPRMRFRLGVYFYSEQDNIPFKDD